MMKKHFFYCAIGVLMVIACGTPKKAAVVHKTPVAQDPQLLNGRWILEQLNGYPMDKDSFDSDKPYIDIQTTTRMYFGYSGCNRINGQITFTESSIHFNPGPMTRMACVEGNIETDFLKALFSSTHYSVGKGKLYLKTASDKVVCRFSKIQ
jgi:heat shock protein HslJ